MKVMGVGGALDDTVLIKLKVSISATAVVVMGVPVHTLARRLAWLRGFICAEPCRGLSDSDVRDL